MLDDIIFIISLTLESLVLIFFIKYTIQYFKQYQETVDPYTKWTLIFLMISLLLQLCRMPVSAMNIALEALDDPYSDFSKWYSANSSQISRLLNLLVYFHAIVQKTAILINILRWQILVINLYNVDVLRKTLIAKFIIIIAVILLIFSSYVMNYIPPSINETEAVPLH